MVIEPAHLDQGLGFHGFRDGLVTAASIHQTADIGSAKK